MIEKMPLLDFLVGRGCEYSAADQVERMVDRMKQQLAAANERADGLQKIVDAARAQKPVAWCVAYDDSGMGRIHSNPTMCRPEAQPIADELPFSAEDQAELDKAAECATAYAKAQPAVVPEAKRSCFTCKHADDDDESYPCRDCTMMVRWSPAILSTTDTEVKK